MPSRRKGDKMNHVEGKLEIIRADYGYRKLCQQSDTKHEDIIEDVVTEQVYANLGEIARRWNAFEKDGLVADLLATDKERKCYAATIKKIWAALGVMDYKAADGKSIDELVLLIKQQRDDLLTACRLWERAIKKGDVKTKDLGTEMLIGDAIEKTKQAIAKATPEVKNG